MAVSCAFNVGRIFYISPAAIAAEINPPRVGEPSTLILGVAQVPEYSGTPSF
ncbi:MAG: hypothetical protein AB8B84_03185 [Granulosicoccus sp.]